MTIKERMERLGWFHQVDDDCEAGWFKCDKDNRVIAYGHQRVFETDIQQCRADAVADQESYAMSSEWQLENMR